MSWVRWIGSRGSLTPWHYVRKLKIDGRDVTYCSNIVRAGAEYNSTYNALCDTVCRLCLRQYLSKSKPNADKQERC
jgi:hypothetical protein